MVSAELVPLGPPGLVDGRRLPSPPTLLPAVCLISYKDTRQNGLGWTLMASWYLNYLCEDPCPQIPLPSEVLGVRTSICGFWGAGGHSSACKRGGAVFTSVLHQSQLSAACGILGAPCRRKCDPSLSCPSPLACLVSGEKGAPLGWVSGRSSAGSPPPLPPCGAGVLGLAAPPGFAQHPGNVGLSLL